MAGEVDAEEVLRIAKAVAKRYANRCWWADQDDMEQEAAVAVLRATRTWDPQVGVPFDAYAQRAAALGIRAHLWRESTPVTGGQHDPRRNVAGVRRADLDRPSYGDPDGVDHGWEGFVHEHAPRAPSPVEELSDVRWRLAVRRRVRQLSGRTQHGDAAHEVIVRGKEPQEVCEETGLTQAQVYRSVELVRRKVRTDAASYELLRRRRRG